MYSSSDHDIFTYQKKGKKEKNKRQCCGETFTWLDCEYALKSVFSMAILQNGHMYHPKGALSCSF